jgi:hypothetical protein
MQEVVGSIPIGSTLNKRLTRNGLGVFYARGVNEVDPL